MTEVTDDIEAVVEDTQLPRRLKDQVYDTIEERDGVTVEQADEIAQAVEAQYLESRVDPLDPVGTVSAQSIGEPGTQMSVPSDERVFIRRDGEPRVTEIGPLVDSLMDARETREFDGHEVSLAPDGLEALSLGRDEQVRWKPVREISRHGTPTELLRFELESGREVRATKAHSFVTRRDNELVPVAADTLAAGDRLPVVGDFDPDERTVDIPRLDRTVAADGGVGAHSVQTTDDRVVATDVEWDRIESVETVTSEHEYVYDFSVDGLETFTTAEGVVTHNTMNTFHYAGVAEIDVTQGLPRLIELVDARKEPDTPMMTVHLEGEYATDRERAHEVVWNIEATRILALGDVSTNVADMLVRIDLKEGTLRDRWPKLEVEDGDGTSEETDEEQLDRAIEGPREGLEYVKEPGRGIMQTISKELSGINGPYREGQAVVFEPEQPSYRDLLQLVEELRDVVFKGIEDISRVVIRKEETDDGEEFVLYTEGSAFGKVLDIEGVDATRTTCNNIHEIHRELGIEAAREAIINETMNTLEEQGLDDVNVRHLMLVADIMTNGGTIQSIGRHGISGSKESVLARAAFEVTVNHLLDAAVHGEVDDLNGVTENVIVGKPIQLGTGDVDLRMGAKRSGSGTGTGTGESADD